MNQISINGRRQSFSAGRIEIEIDGGPGLEGERFLQKGSLNFWAFYFPRVLGGEKKKIRSRHRSLSLASFVGKETDTCFNSSPPPNPQPRGHLCWNISVPERGRCISYVSLAFDKPPKRNGGAVNGGPISWRWALSMKSLPISATISRKFIWIFFLGECGLLSPERCQMFIINSYDICDAQE